MILNRHIRIAMLERNEVRRLLKSRGWSYRRAGAYLGISYPHICLVLQGKRESKRLLRAIAALPDSPEPYRECGFATTPYRRTAASEVAQ